jgi:hypothetical protein
MRAFCAAVQRSRPCAGLLLPRALGELGGLELAEQLGVRADERELLRHRGVGEGALHGRVQVLQRREWPRGEGALGDPGRMLVDAAQARDEVGLAEGVQRRHRDQAGRAPEGMARDPVARDLHAPANPHAVVALHVVEESRERRQARWPPGEAAMQPIESIFGASRPPRRACRRHRAGTRRTARRC